MRLAALSMSAILLSGCSWLGGVASPDKNYRYNQNSYASQNSYATGAPGHMGMRGGQNPCVIYSPVQPVPTGCDPRQVRLEGAHGGQQGYNQGYNMGQPTYATGGYGSHADSAHRSGSYEHAGKRVRKPRLRGSLSLGTERSVAGNILTPDASTFPYDPLPFNEGRIDDTDPALLETTLYTSIVEGVEAPSLSFQDIHQSPASIKAGLEYIVSPKFTMFANGGYTHATGANDASATVVGRVTKTVTRQDLDPNTGANIGAPIINTQFLPNTEVANFLFDFSDHRQFDLEAGARHYFSPIYQDQGYKTITPFVGAAVGVSHVNAITYKTQQNQLYLADAIDNGEPYNYYDVPTADQVSNLYDDAWLINGGLTAGMEWQVTPKTAFAFETGLKAYQERDFVSGEAGDMNVTVPLTLRGSYNF